MGAIASAWLSVFSRLTTRAWAASLALAASAPEPVKLYATGFGTSANPLASPHTFTRNGVKSVPTS